MFKRGPQHMVWTRSPTTNPLTIHSLSQIITTKYIVQTKMLTEKAKRKKSELTGIAAILFYPDLPSHVLLRVCRFPLSCLLPHLEPGYKRRDLIATLCHPTALPARAQ